MFWRLPFRPTSSLDATIARTDVTLFNVMDDEDIIQEGKTQNPKLCDFISIPENLLALVKLITKFPSEEMEEKIRYKYPNIACELLISNMGNISEVLLNEYFELLTSFLDVSPPLNPLFSSFNCKVLNFLCKNKPGDFFSNIRLYSNVIPGLLRHVGTSSCMDLLLQFVTTGEHQHLDFIHWLDDNNLVQSLVSLIRASSSADVCFNASQLLLEFQNIERECCIDNVDSCIFIQVMESKEVIEDILNSIFLYEEGPSRTVHLQCCISILQGLLQPVRSMDQMIYPDLSLPIRLGDCNITSNSSIGSYTTKEMPLSKGGTKVLNMISYHVSDFHTLLNQSPEILLNGTSVLGYRRLVIIRLLTTILQVTPSHFQCRFVSSGVVKTLLNFFYRFPWNNFLHTQVEIIIKTLLSPLVAYSEDITSDTNIISNSSNNQETDSIHNLTTPHENFRLLLTEGQIIEKILLCWDSNKASQLYKGRRMGFMGHLTNITNKVTDILQSDANFLSIFNDHIPKEILERWNQLISEDLSEQNFKNESKMGSDSIVSNFTPPDLDVQTDPILTQAYTEYQLFPVSSNFEDGFGVDDDSVNEEVISDPFSELDSFDFSLDSDEDKSGIQAFLDMCDDTINLFDEPNPIISIESEELFPLSNGLKSDIESDEDDDDDDEDNGPVIPDKIKSSIHDPNDIIESHIIYTQTVNILQSHDNPIDVHSPILQKEVVPLERGSNDSPTNWPLDDENNTNAWAEFGPFSNISSEVKSQGNSTSKLAFDDLTEIIEKNLPDSDEFILGYTHNRQVDENDDKSVARDAFFLEYQPIDKYQQRIVEPLTIHSDSEFGRVRIDDIDADIHSDKNANDFVSDNVESVTLISTFGSKYEDMTSETLNVNCNNNNNIGVDILDGTDVSTCGNFTFEEENYSFLDSLGLIHDFSSIPDLNTSESYMLQDIDSSQSLSSNVDNTGCTNCTSSSETLRSIVKSRELAFKAHNDYLMVTGQSHELEKS